MIETILTWLFGFLLTLAGIAVGILLLVFLIHFIFLTIRDIRRDL